MERSSRRRLDMASVSNLAKEDTASTSLKSKQVLYSVNVVTDYNVYM